jgi:hypothetical protein
MAIKEGSHGTTPFQKRYWKIVSEVVREEDWRKYGKCVSCGIHIDDWRFADCGHYKAWARCNGWFKFDRRNLSIQCKGCNRLSDGPVGHNFGKELKRRYGPNHLDWIEQENLRHKNEKIEAWQLVEATAKLRPDLVYED